MPHHRGDARWLAPLLAAAAMSAALPAAAADEAMTGSVSQDQPITLVVSKDGALIDARVMAAAPCDCAGRFRIESRSGSSNNSVNTSSFGTIKEAGRVLSHVRFGGSDDWSIRLTVSIDGRDDYVVIRSSAEGE
jgi:hypothetical protein